MIGGKYFNFFFLKWQAHFVYFLENVCQMPNFE